MTLHLDGRRIEAAVFDFDGVLADTAAGWSRAEAALCENYGVDYTDALAAGTHGVGLADAVRALTAAVDPPVVHAEAVERLRDLADRYVPEDVQAVEGGVDAVRALARRVPVAIASNSERPLLEHLVRALGLGDTVSTVVSASDVAAPKPAPDVYREAARRLGAAPERTLAVEDSPTGGAAAHAAGCVVVALALADTPLSESAPAWGAVTVRSHADLLARVLPAGSTPTTSTPSTPTTSTPSTSTARTRPVAHRRGDQSHLRERRPRP